MLFSLLARTVGQSRIVRMTPAINSQQRYAQRISHLKSYASIKIEVVTYFVNYNSVMLSNIYFITFDRVVSLLFFRLRRSSPQQLKQNATTSSSGRPTAHTKFKANSHPNDSYRELYSSCPIVFISDCPHNLRTHFNIKFIYTNLP